MRLSNIFRAILPLFVIANSYTTPVASASEAVQRPKVALVLSGGGAKGVSHVGVIRYLREGGIPIDMVVGTSMGSIVGGMYSLGYSDEQIAKWKEEKVL